MDIIDNFFSGFTVFSALLAMVFACIIHFRHSDHQQANYYLTAFLLMSGTTYAIYGVFAVIPEAAYRVPWILFVAQTLELSVIPLCYCYVRALYHLEGAPYQPKWWLHSLIPLCMLVMNFSTIISTEKQIYRLDAWFKKDYSDINEVSISFFVVVLLVQLAVYTILMLLSDNRYRQQIKSVLSNIESAKLGWVRSIVVYWVIYLLLNLYFYCWPIITHDEVSGYFTYLFIGINIVFYLYVATQTSLHPYLFTVAEASAVHAYANDTNKQRKTLSEAQANELQEQLLDLLITKKPYLNAELTISELAKMLNMGGSYYLSQLLSSRLNENFYELINRYRVEEAKFLLETKPQETMINIAYASGFKSTSTFYTYFKKLTGMTPRDYLIKQS